MTSVEAFHRLLAELETVPARPRSLAGPENWLSGILLFADYLASVPPRMAKITAPFRKYPSDFQRVRFHSADGTRLAAWYGRPKAQDARPGLILIPGLFTSKDNNRIRARSIKVLREWGFHILTLDLRGIGESERRYFTPGAKEAEDIVAAVAWLRAQPGVGPIHLYTESLAAAAVLVAAGREGSQGKALVDGNILSVSPYGDPAVPLERFSGPIPWRDPTFGPLKAFFKGVLRMSGMKENEFIPYVHKAAEHYGLSYERLLAESNGLNYVADSKSPILILHSLDDIMVPVAEAERIREAAKANPLVRVWVLPWGNHCLYEMAEPDWYWTVLERFFGAESKQRPGRNGARTRKAAVIPTAARK